MKVRELCQRYVREMRLGDSHRCGLERIQTYPVAQIDADKLRSSHIVDFARMRRQTVGPATVMNDISYLRSVLSYASVGWDMADVSDQPISDAIKKMHQLRLVSGPTKRKRIPTPDERERIKHWFHENYRGAIPTDDVLDFQFYSSRRVSETFRLRWGDLDEGKKTVLVRDMKHPRRKTGNNKRVALPDEAFAIVMRQPRRTTNPEERIFPYSHKTMIRLHSIAVAACGITDLHLHDHRRGTVTWLIKEKGRSVPDVMLVTGHETPQMPLTVYNGLQAEDFHKPC